MSLSQPRSPYDIKDLSLAAAGRQRIAWASNEMPVLNAIRSRFAAERPLAGLRIAVCLHITTETAQLARTLAAGGAELVLVASNALSTQDDVAAALVADDQMAVYAIRGEDLATHQRHLHAALDHQPHLLMDDGADLVTMLIQQRPDAAGSLFGATEETTTGVVRARAMQHAGVLRFPVVAVNDSPTKHLFDNRYGTGQSTIDGVIRATNLLLAGKTVVVAGYGWCSRGIAMRARGLGAHVVVTEVDAIKGLEAVMDGFPLLPMREAAAIGHIFLTATGNIDVIDAEHMALMRDGATLANAGHFDSEINIGALDALAVARSEPREHICQYELANGRRINVLAGGRLVNLVAAEGHPSSVMDMSFANQALGAEYLVKQRGSLSPQVYALPEAVNQEIAAIKLAAMGYSLDRLTPAQETYMRSWELGAWEAPAC